jgi:hypothetical protein
MSWMKLDYSNMSNPRKRFYHAKENELKMGWGLINGEPDIIYSSGSNKSDCAFLHYWLSPRPELDLNSPIRYKIGDKNFLEELDERGYDISTLKFSIKKKQEKE